MSGARASGETVVRRSGRGWVVGDEEASDLTSAMVLADLLAADLAPSGSAPSGSAPSGSAPSGSAPSGSAPSGSAPSGSAASSTQARRGPAAARRAADTAPAAPQGRPPARSPHERGGRGGRGGAARCDGHPAPARADRPGPGRAGHRGPRRATTASAPAMPSTCSGTRPGALAAGRRHRGDDVVNSTSNALLRLPEELERKPEPRARIRSARRLNRLPVAGPARPTGPSRPNSHRAALTSQTGNGAAARSRSP